LGKNSVALAALVALGAIDCAAHFARFGFTIIKIFIFRVLAPFLALNSNVLFCLVADFTFVRVERAKLRSTLQTRDDLTHMIVHDLRSP
jgi:hypothetical protein